MLIFCAGCKQPQPPGHESFGTETPPATIFGYYIKETSSSYSHVKLLPDSTYVYLSLINCIGEKHDTGSFRMHGDTLLFLSHFKYDGDTAVVSYSNKIRRIYSDTCLLENHRIYRSKNTAGYFDPNDYWIEETYFPEELTYSNEVGSLFTSPNAPNHYYPR